MAMTDVPVLDNVEVGDHLKMWGSSRVAYSFAPAGTTSFGAHPEGPRFDGVKGQVVHIERRARSFVLFLLAKSARADLDGGLWQVSAPPSTAFNWDHLTQDLDIDGTLVPIDTRIAPLVTAVRQAGLQTIFCCEGSLRPSRVTELELHHWDSQLMFATPEDAVAFVRASQELGLDRYCSHLKISLSPSPSTAALRGEIRFPFQLLPILTHVWAPGHERLFDGFVA